METQGSVNVTELGEDEHPKVRGVVEPPNHPIFDELKKRHKVKLFWGPIVENAPIEIDEETGMKVMRFTKDSRLIFDSPKSPDVLTSQS